jgi:hypothetical protein
MYRGFEDPAGRLKSVAPAWRMLNRYRKILADEPLFASSSASRPADQIEVPEYVPARFILTPRVFKMIRLLVVGKK